jgi:hypothetical protein
MSIIRTIPYAVLSAGLLAAGGASAQSLGSIDAREANQQERIEQGRADGELTRGEARRLERGEQRIERYEARARADGVVTPQERQHLDGMLNRESRDIYRESHDGQRADRRGEGRDGWGRDRDRDAWNHGGDRDRDDRRADGRGWGDRDGRRDGSGHDRDRDAWNHGGDRDRDGGNRGLHEGWTRGEHNGWDGNRPPGIERRDARDQQRIYNGARDGSLTRGEFGQLERGQERIDRTEAHARADGVVTPGERNRINGMQNRESQQIYNDRHNSRTATGTPPTTGTQPTTGQPATGTHNWGNGGWRTQQASMPTTGTQPSTASRNWGGFRTQPASGTATAPAAPRPTFTRTASTSTSTSSGGHSGGARH